MMAGRAPEIQAERERKLKEAREQRKLANRRKRVTLTAHRETEDGSLLESNRPGIAMSCNGVDRAGG